MTMHYITNTLLLSFVITILLYFLSQIIANIIISKYTDLISPIHFYFISYVFCLLYRIHTHTNIINRAKKKTRTKDDKRWYLILSVTVKFIQNWWYNKTAFIATIEIRFNYYIFLWFFYFYILQQNL